MWKSLYCILRIFAQYVRLTRVATAKKAALINAEMLSEVLVVPPINLMGFE